MLSPNPENRPLEKEVLKSFLQILHKIDKKTAKKLEQMFEYFDSIAEFSQYEYRIRLIQQLSHFPEQLNDLILDVIKEIDFFKKKKSQTEVVHLCNLCQETALLLLKRNIASDRDRAKSYTELMIKEIMKLKGKLSTLSVYPNRRFKGFRIYKSPHHERDFELYAQIIGEGAELLKKMIGGKKTESFFLKKDDYTISAYYKHIASRASLNDPIKAVKVLDKCFKYNPDEALFYYLKSQWLFRYYLEINILDNIDEKEKIIVRRKILENLDKAIEMDSKWLPPKNLKRNVKNLV